MVHLRHCLTCGAEYEYCPKCGKHAGKPGWMIEFDNEMCKEIFDVVSGYNMNIKTLDDVKSVVDKYNIKDFDKYTPGVKKVLSKITVESKPVMVETPVILEEKPMKKNKKKWFSTLEETPVVEEPIVDIALDTVNATDEPVVETNIEGISEE